MTIAEVLPNLKELQDTNKLLINQLIHSHDEPHGKNFKKFSSLQCFFKLRANLGKRTKHVCNIPHKKVSKKRSTAENFLNHIC